MTGLVFKFYHMFYEKHIIWTEKDKIMKWMAFCENKVAECLENAVNFLVA
jgi:hypothetical protein